MAFLEKLILNGTLATLALIQTKKAPLTKRIEAGISSLRNMKTISASLIVL